MNLISDLKTDDFPFYIEYVKQTTPHTMAAMHLHNHYEFFFLLSGERIYFINDRTYSLQAGDMIFIKPHEIHKTVNYKSSQYERILLSFEFSFLDEITQLFPELDLAALFDENLLRVKSEEQTQIELILFRLLAEQTASRATSTAQMKLLLMHLLIMIFDLRKEQADQQFSYPNAVHEKISEIIRYINQNFRSSISLDEISDQFFISKYYFCRNFKTITGLSFIKYLNYVRVKEAQNLLRNSNLRIADVAKRCGFDSTSHFSRVFKTTCGMSALSYRSTTLSNKQ